MAKKNPIERNTAAKWERTYGSQSRWRVPNMMQDIKAGRKPTGSFLRYASGEMRAISINGGKAQRMSATQLTKTKNTLIGNATGSYRGMKL